MNNQSKRDVDVRLADLDKRIARLENLQQDPAAHNRPSYQEQTERRGEIHTSRSGARHVTEKTEKLTKKIMKSRAKRLKRNK